MCPNRDCSRHDEPTGLMGGCDCGTPLVPYKTLDQQVDDAIWDIASPGMKRLVGAALFGQMEAARRRRDD